MTTRLNKFRSSNSKEVKEAIRSHIIERLDPEAGEAIADQLQNVITGFKHWLGNARYPSQYAAFKAYLQCIPSTLDAEFTWHRQDEALVQWLGRTGKDYSQDETEERYYHLIHREFKMLCKLNSINF